jgi:ABC-type transport system involved in cytochrome c biogenesis ATPase subunit
MSANGILLSVACLSVSYDSIRAVDDISFDVARGEIVTLIGANGAGKSSILRAVSGLIPYTGGITYEGRDLKNIAADRIVGLGIAHVPEGRGIFGNLTVLENLKLAAWRRKDKIKIKADLEHVFTLFPRLRERGRQQGGMLSGGEQQMRPWAARDERRAAAASGRTVHGAFARPVSRDFQNHFGNQPGGENRFARRTKRSPVPADCLAGLCSGNRADCAFGNRKGTDRQSPREGSLSRRIRSSVVF